MPVNKQLIENLKRNLKRDANIDKFINKLRVQSQLDLLIDICLDDQAFSELTLLMYYTCKNNIAKIRELLSGKNPANPIATNKQGFHALMLAILAIKPETQFILLPVIDELLKYQPNEQLLVNTPLGSVLQFAIYQGYYQLVEKFLPFVNINILLLASPTSKWIPLHAAAEKNAISIAKNLLMIEPEKQVMQENEDGWLPLFIALHHGYLPLAQILLQYDPEKQLLHKTRKNQTVFEVIIASKSIEILKWINKVYPNPFKAIIQESHEALKVAMLIDDLSMISYCLHKSDKTKELLLTPSEKGLPLRSALLLDQVEQVKLLLQYYPKEQIEYTDSYGNNIFHSCGIFRAYKSLSYIIEVMLALNLDLSSFLLKTNSIGAIPISLTIAAILNEESLSLEEKNTLELMIQLNIKQLEYVETFENHIETALEFAIGQGKKAVVHLLLEKGPASQLAQKHPPKNFSPLALALSLHNFEMAEIILNVLTSEDLFICNIVSCAPLHHAVAAKQNRFATALMNHKFSALLFNSDMTGKETDRPFTPLHLALYCSNYWAAKELIQRGANVNVVGNEGRTPIHMVCVSGSLAVIQLLIDAKAKLDVRDDRGNTPLHLAAGNGNLAAIKLIINHYKDYDIPNNDGFTPLLIAVLFDQEEIARFLIKEGANINTTCIVVSADGVETHLTPFLIAIDNMNLNWLFSFSRG